MYDDPSVSIIIPTLNSTATIGICLDAILELDYPGDRIRVIAVDHGSQDDTEHIALSRGAEFHSNPQAVSIAALRNTGAEKSDSDLLAFIDSDCIPHRDWLRNAIGVMNEHNVQVVGSDHIIVDEPSRFERLWFDLRKHRGTSENIFIPSGNFIIDRKVFLEIGGFDADFISGEDADICYRLIKKGHRIISSDSIKVVHLNEPKTLSEFFRKEIWHGKGMFRIFSRHIGMDVVKVPLISLAYLTALIVCILLVIGGSYLASAIIALLFAVVAPLSLSIIKFMRGLHRDIIGAAVIYLTYFTARMVSLVRYNQCGDLIKMLPGMFRRRGA